MKTAIYIEDGTVQLVITPETDFEKKVVDTFRDKPISAKIFSGSFYDCRGGWVRQSPIREKGLGGFQYNDGDSHYKSLIIRSQVSDE